MDEWSCWRHSASDIGQSAGHKDLSAATVDRIVYKMYRRSTKSPLLLLLRSFCLPHTASSCLYVDDSFIVTVFRAVLDKRWPTPPNIVIHKPIYSTQSARLGQQSTRIVKTLYGRPIIALVTLYQRREDIRHPY